MSVQENRVDEAVLCAPLAENSGILVAVSGGADSVALLNSLHRINQAYTRGWRLTVAHVNHQLRGEDSSADADFVRGIAAEMRLPIQVITVNTRNYARAHRLSVETAAREQRYAALEEARARYGAKYIAVAHTRDDQAETALFRLVRGTGLHGMAAMRERSARIVRPLLSVTRSDVRTALGAEGIEYREDRSNDDPAYTRNRIRSEVMPLLEEIHPRAVATIARAATLLGRDSAYITHEVKRLLPMLAVRVANEEVSASAPVWRALNPALQGHVLHTLFGTALGETRDVTETHIEVASRAIQSGLDVTIGGQLPGNLTLTCTPLRFSLWSGGSPKEGPMPAREFAVPGTLVLSHGRLDAVLLADTDQDALHRSITVAGPLHLFADQDRLGMALRVRSRQPGDRMRPFGLHGSRKIQDILTDAKVPRDKRNRIAIVENERHIVWLVGIAVDERVLAHQHSKAIVHVMYKQGSNEIP